MTQKNECLDDHTIFLMTEAGPSSLSHTAAFAHLATCIVCRQRYSELDVIEDRLRVAARDLNSLPLDASVDRAISSVIGRIHSEVDRETVFAECKEKLLHVLTPLCGTRLTERSIEMATNLTSREAVSCLEEEWECFVKNLGEILYRVCGSTVKRAVYEISGATFAGAAL